MSDPHLSAKDAGTSFVDNWTIQDAARAIVQGLSQTPAHLVEVDRAANAHSWVPVPEAALQLQCLVDVITDIVLRQHMVVEADYDSTWRDKPTSLPMLVNAGIVVPLPVSAREASFYDRRDVVLRELCATSTLERVQRENEESFRRTRQSIHGHEAALIWGGAGNATRASLLGVLYTAHPSRQRLMEQAGLFLDRQDITRDSVEWIQRERTTLVQQLLPGKDRRLAMMELPPLVAEIVLASQDPADLVATALAARDEYAKLREWVTEYQRAIDEEDPASLARNKRTLDAVARDIAALTGRGQAESAVSLGVGWFNLPLPVQRVADAVGRRFGVRAVFNRLLLSKRTENALDRLLGMFGERETLLGQDVRRYFHARATQVSRDVG